MPLPLPVPVPLLLQGVHPRIIADGFELAKGHAVDFLEKFWQPKGPAAEPAAGGAGAGAGAGDDAAAAPLLGVGGSVRRETWRDREFLLMVAKTALRTKLVPEMADQLAEIVADAVLCIRPADGSPIDLHMVERMHMLHRTDKDSRLVRGLVMDHGGRHPDMPSYLENCYILTANVSGPGAVRGQSRRQTRAARPLPLSVEWPRGSERHSRTGKLPQGAAAELELVQFAGAHAVIHDRHLLASP